jgi:hypothetical protein
LVSDRSNRQTSDTERVDLGVTTFVPNLRSALRREGRCGSLFIERRQFVGRALFVQWRQDAHRHSFKSIREVVDDVPSIGDLHSSWCTTPRRAGIHAISVASTGWPRGRAAMTHPLGHLAEMVTRIARGEAVSCASVHEAVWLGFFPLKLVLGALLDGDRRQVDGVSQLFETAHVVALDACGVELIQVVDAEFGVGLPGLKDLVSHDE